jgi:hypothetical protein
VYNSKGLLTTTPIKTCEMIKENISQRNSFSMVCKKCGHNWNYTGSRRGQFYLTCPRCKTSQKFCDAVIKRGKKND